MARKESAYKLIIELSDDEKRRLKWLVFKSDQTRQGMAHTGLLRYMQELERQYGTEPTEASTPMRAEPQPDEEEATGGADPQTQARTLNRVTVIRPAAEHEIRSFSKQQQAGKKQATGHGG